MKFKRSVLCGLFLVLAAASLIAQAPEVAATEEATEADIASAAKAREGREPRTLDRIGLIFNSPSILLELDEFHGVGVGAKGFWDNLALRGLFAIDFQTNTEIFGVALGTAIEFHPTPATVSPYVGGELLVDYRQDRAGPTFLKQFGITIGPLFGVEIAPWKTVSFFAEYRLAFRAAYASSSGSTEDDERWNYSIGTELGNRGSIGIIVYFLDRRSTVD